MLVLIELNLRYRLHHERDAPSGINVVRDMYKSKPNIPFAAVDVFQDDVHRIVADVISGGVGMTHVRAKVDVESSR